MKNDELIWMREHSGMTQKELAALFGVHPVTVSGWETGKHPMPVRQFYALKKLLNIDTTGMPRKLTYDERGYPVTPDNFADDDTWEDLFLAAEEAHPGNVIEPRERALLKLEGQEYTERTVTRYRLAAQKHKGWLPERIAEEEASGREFAAGVIEDVAAGK